MAEIALLPSTAGPSKIQPQSLPAELDQVVRLVDAKPEALARGDAEMYAAALAATKMIYGLALDTEKSAAKPISKLLRGLSPGEDAPTTRAQKRKREDAAKPPPLTFRPTPKAGRLAGVEASWSAAKLWEHMEYRAGPLCGILEAVVAPEDIIEEEEEEEETEEELEADESGEVAFDDDEDGADYSASEEDEDEDEDEDEEDESGSDEDESDGGESHLGETTMELSRGEDHSGSSDEEDEDEEEEEATSGGYLDGLDLDREENPQKVAKKRAHPTLDDGFFSIDAFNRETEALEAQSRSSGALNDEDEEDEDDVDIFMNVEDVEDNEDDVNDPQYKDFFAPPPKPKKAAKSNPAPKPGSPSKAKRKLKLLVASPPKRSTIVRFNEEVRVRKIKSKRTRASLLAELAEAEGDEEEEGEGEEGAWASDMLDGSEGSDEESGDDDGSEESEEVAGKGGKAKGDLFAEDEPTDENGTALSSYQQRLADLSAEIKALEAENVAPKPWTLQGEATARSRPQNALLSADLEFEHVGKVAPIVTEETVKKLEDRIKARIIEGRYDDVVRKRETDAKPFLPSRMFELKDTQSEKSLAQIYEDEYTASRGGPSAGPVDDRDGKLAQEHKEIEELWDGICYKLDALSNAHFTPKQPKAQITTVSNIASASMESALPTSLSTSTLLAPEEVYAPAAGDARAKGELTPGEKRAARTKERKKRRKQRDALSGAVDKFGANGAIGGRGAPRNVKEAKSQALKGLVKNGKGVTVVGKDSSRAAGKGKGIKETSAKSKDEGPARDSKKFKL